MTNLLNVSHFKPEELNVKIVDNFMVVEAKHEERPDELGYVYRHFTRRYVLPPGVKPEQITSKLSADGVLTITAPRAMPEPAPSSERIIPIQQTAAPAVAPQQPADAQVQPQEHQQKYKKNIRFINFIFLWSLCFVNYKKGRRVVRYLWHAVSAVSPFHDASTFFIIGYYV